MAMTRDKWLNYLKREAESLLADEGATIVYVLRDDDADSQGIHGVYATPNAAVDAGLARSEEFHIISDWTIDVWPVEGEVPDGAKVGRQS